MSDEEAIMEPKEEQEEEEQEEQEEGEEENEEEATGENDEENNDEGDNPDQEGEDQEQGEEVPEGEEGEKEETEEQGEDTPEVEDKQVSFQEEPTPPPPAKGPSGPIPKNVLNRLITGMWASREMLRQDTDKQIVMKTTLRELIIYCVFLFVIVYMTFSQYSRDFYLLRSRNNVLEKD